MSRDVLDLAHELATTRPAAGQSYSEFIDGIIGRWPHLSDDEIQLAFAKAKAITKAAAKRESAHADALEKLVRLAAATGCPKGTPVLPWLRARGLVEADGKLTDKAKALRLVP